MTEKRQPSPRRNSGRSFRGVAADERRRQRRQQLLDAGLRRFGSAGFHAVGVREVCADAHLTERYFYESFRNREALFLAVYDMALQRIRAAVIAAVMATESDPRTMARAGQRALLESLRADPCLARVLFIEALSVNGEVSRQSRIGMQAFSEIVAALLLNLFPKLSTHGVEPGLLADGLIGSTVHIVMHWASDEFRTPLETILDHCVLFYDALISDAERRLGADAAPTS